MAIPEPALDYSQPSPVESLALLIEGAEDGAALARIVRALKVPTELAIKFLAPQLIFLLAKVGWLRPILSKKLDCAQLERRLRQVGGIDLAGATLDTRGNLEAFWAVDTLLAAAKDDPCGAPEHADENSAVIQTADTGVQTELDADEAPQLAHLPSLAPIGRDPPEAIAQRCARWAFGYVARRRAYRICAFCHVAKRQGSTGDIYVC